MPRPHLVRGLLTAAIALALSICAQASNSARANFPYAGHLGVSTMTAGRVIAGAREPLGGFVVRQRDGASMSYGYCITFGHHAPGGTTRYGPAEAFTGSRARSDRATLGAVSMLIQRYGHGSGDGHADAVDIEAAEVSATVSHIYDEDDRGGQWRWLGRAGTSVAHAEELLRKARAFAGPYTIDVEVPTRALAGGTYALTATIRNAYGPVGAGVAVTLSASGATLSSEAATTDGAGRVAASFTPSAGASQVAVAASASVIDTMQVLRQQGSTRPGQVQDFVFSGRRPSVYRGQAQVAVSHPTMATQASADAVVGSALTDTISVSGTAGSPGLITATLYGPAASAAGPWTRVAGTAQVNVTGDGNYTTAPIAVASAGSYSWGESFVPTGQHTAVATTRPGDVNETTTVSQPQLKTQTSAQHAMVGSSLTDTIAVTGTAASEGVITATLLGPARSAAGPWPTVVHSVDIRVDGDGSYATPPVRVAKPGSYTWRETFTIKGQTQPIATTQPGEVSETTIVAAKPTPHTVAPRPASPPSPTRAGRTIRIETGGTTTQPRSSSALVIVLGTASVLALAIAVRRRADR